jgi:1-acyl-sn-glycerol-3-phosphate acyltransferase
LAVYLVPFFGPLAFAFNSIIGIDRTNISQAIKSLDKARKKMQEQGRSIAISPEGTRSKSGQLQEFKKGAFHLALACKVRLLWLSRNLQNQAPLSPILLYGAYDLWPPGQPFPVSGRVVAQFCPQIEPREYTHLDHNELLQKVILFSSPAKLGQVHQEMLKEVADYYPASFSSSQSLSPSFKVAHSAALSLTYVGFYLFCSYLYTIISSFFL